MKCYGACLFLLLSSSLSLAETPPPPTVIINYGSFNGGVAGPVTATPPVTAAVAPIVPASVPPTENEPEGVSVALNLGYLSAVGSGAFGTVGVSPQWRFLRFFSIEGEGSLAVKSLNWEGQNNKKPYSLAVQIMAQLTFRSALFDLTPRFGLGVAKRGEADSLGSGPYSVLGGEVKIGPLRLAADIRRISSERVQYSPTYASIDPYYSYPYDFMPSTPVRQAATTELDLRASWDLSDRGRLGARCQALGDSGQFQLFYKFGL